MIKSNLCNRLTVMRIKSSRRPLIAASALSLSVLLAACGGSSETADSATSAAADAAASATSAAASATSAAADAAASALPDESEACKQFAELDQQINDEGASAAVTAQLQQIEQLAKDEGDKEVEAAAREMLSSETGSPGWNEGLEQMEAVCGGEREGN